MSSHVQVELADCAYACRPGYSLQDARSLNYTALQLSSAGKFWHSSSFVLAYE